MKRLDLYDLILFWGGIDIRPSLLVKVEKDIEALRAWNYKGLCSLTEKDLLLKKNITPAVLEKIKSFLGRYGLRLGMTEDELDAYMDAEYLEAHPEEAGTCHKESKTSNATISFIEDKDDAMVLKDNGNEDFHKEKQTVIDETVSSTNPHDSISQPFDENKEAVKAVRQTYQEPLEWVRHDDWEWYIHQARLFLLISQPWYVKCFVPFKKRVKKAFRQADELIAKYRTDMAASSLFFRKLKAHGQYERWMSGDEIFQTTTSSKVVE